MKIVAAFDNGLNNLRSLLTGRAKVQQIFLNSINFITNLSDEDTIKGKL